jgi:4-amino-4-deoxy-L-arabinose transferase-like glycosyltransferase
MTRRTTATAAALLLVAGGALSYAAALTESFTTDEPSHLTAGASYLATGDYRLNPEHPVLAKIWAALPLRFVSHAAFTKKLNGWSYGGTRQVALDWLERKNDGNRLLRPARAMMIPLFVGLGAAVGWTAYRLLGREAGLLALALVVFEPLLLAHGHYVTTDVPVALCVTLSLLSFAAFLRRPAATTFSATAVSLSAAALVKYSWVLVIPALVLMTAAAYLRHRTARPGGKFPWIRLAALPAIVGAAIWAAYGFRFDPFRPGDPPAPAARSWQVEFAKGEPPPFSPVSRNDAWQAVLLDNARNPRTGPSVTLVNLARQARLLPEAYLYGFTYATRNAESRRAYLHGQFSETGWRAYFPVAYLVKTPVPELLLLLAGTVALATRRARITGDPILALGVFTFPAVYAAAAVLTNLNIGLRHMIPVYPALLVVASASTAWATSRAGRIGVFALAAGMAAVAAVSFPYYLGYFNELAGGWRGGHRWLVDSNLDWDQDFLRVRDYQRLHPQERLVFLSLGDSPIPPGLKVAAYVPRRPGQPWPPPPSAGTYVISATWLVGTFQPFSREEAWENARLRSTYETLWYRWLGRPPPGTDESEEARWSYSFFDGLRRALLLQRLHQRPPDERIGTSFFVYRLTDGEIEHLTRPE